MQKYMRRVNISDPAPKLFNEEITSGIHLHKTYGRSIYMHTGITGHNPHTCGKPISGPSNRAPTPTLNTSIPINNNITTTPKSIAYSFTKQFINTARHTRLYGYSITLTTTQVQEAIKQRENNNSHGPHTLNFRHLTHICPHGLAFSTIMFNTALNNNITPHIWKMTNIFHIQKVNKDIDNDT